MRLLALPFRQIWLRQAGPGDDGRIDFLAADLFVQGFDPGFADRL